MLSHDKTVTCPILTVSETGTPWSHYVLVFRVTTFLELSRDPVTPCVVSVVSRRNRSTLGLGTLQVAAQGPVGLLAPLRTDGDPTSRSDTKRDLRTPGPCV